MITFPAVSLETIKLLEKLYPKCFLGQRDMSAIEAMQFLKGHMVQNLRKSVTNLSLEHLELYGFKFIYSYTRQNLHFAEQPQLHEIYPRLQSKQAPYYSSFHTSGQAAISSLFIGLSQIWKKFHLHTLSKTYFETPLALRLLNKGNEAREGEPFLFIDSTSIEPEHVSNLIELIKSFKIMIIDTSLWAWNEPLLQKMINEVEGKIDLFLVRSHLKLDCFGGEYATLGSIVYLPGHSTNEEDKSRMIECIQDGSSSIGACPSLDQIYPFYKEPEYHELTIKRIQEIQNSLKRITPQLIPLIDSSKITFEVPYHGMFFFMNLDSENEEIRKQILKFIRLDSGLVAMIDSYGFDFPTVLVTNVRLKKSEYFIRMNGHTLGEARDQEVIETLKKIIHVANTSARSNR